jgi:8-oxo-dGTP diphosphatase
MSKKGKIRAAGCLVYRHGEDGIEVLVAHRPRYDDWDFPKGKLEDGESELECAIRETEEETGYTGDIGDELPADHYVVRDRDKTVRWWLLRQTGGQFVENDEVDEVVWLSPDAAAKRLSYDHAQKLLTHLPE